MPAPSLLISPTADGGKHPDLVVVIQDPPFGFVTVVDHAKEGHRRVDRQYPAQIRDCRPGGNFQPE